jgi:hypothetical protein
MNYTKSQVIEYVKTLVGGSAAEEKYLKEKEDENNGSATSGSN